MEFFENDVIMERDEEGGVPRAVMEGGGGETEVGCGDGNGSVADKVAVATEERELGGAEEEGPAAADEGEGGKGSGGDTRKTVQNDVVGEGGYGGWGCRGDRVGMRG